MPPLPHEKRILITGCSSGFGRLAVSLLLQHGHSVLAGIRGGEERLRAIFGTELERYPGRLHAIDLHLDQPSTLEEASKAVEAIFGGRLDVLINNAGYGFFGALADTRPEELRHQFEVNFFGPALLTRNLLPSLRAAHGRVINVSSVVGLSTFPGYGIYSASKHALEAVTEGLYYELRPYDVQVALLEPGGFRTEFARGSKKLAAGTHDPGSDFGWRTRKMIDLVEKFEHRLPPPGAVVRRMVALVETKKMPLRNLVGTDAFFVNLLRRIVPDRVRIALLYQLQKRVIGR